MTPADLLEDALACARLTQLVTDDQIAAPLRDAVARRWPDSRVSYLVNCPHCVAVWVAGFGVLAGWLAPRWWGPVRRGLAVSMVAGHAVARLGL